MTIQELEELIHYASFFPFNINTLVESLAEKLMKTILLDSLVSYYGFDKIPIETVYEANPLK